MNISTQKISVESCLIFKKIMNVNKAQLQATVTN